jgi:hypothetical protein
MVMIPPPEGLSAEDYDAIEAAVTETVRGRWFLAEYARRSRVDELQQMLEGLRRLEQTVRDQQLPADPSIRLLVQRLKDVSQRLDGLATDMRAHGIAEAYCGDIETQARAVAGLLRGAPPVKMETHAAPAKSAPLPPPAPAAESPPALIAQKHVLPTASLPPQLAPRPPQAAAPAAVAAPSLPRVDQAAALTRLDRLSTAEKVTLFS